MGKFTHNLAPEPIRAKKTDSEKVFTVCLKPQESINQILMFTPIYSSRTTDAFK
jgi:hypothetical protein